MNCNKSFSSDLFPLKFLWNTLEHTYYNELKSNGEPTSSLFIIHSKVQSFQCFEEIQHHIERNSELIAINGQRHCIQREKYF